MIKAVLLFDSENSNKGMDVSELNKANVKNVILLK